MVPPNPPFSLGDTQPGPDMSAFPAATPAAATVTTTPNEPGDGAAAMPADEVIGATGGAAPDPASMPPGTAPVTPGAAPNAPPAPVVAPVDVAPPADVPPPPGRAAPSPAVPPAPDPDPQSINDLAGQLVPILRDSMADALEVGRETLQAGATYYAPLIAKQALLESSDDPRVAAKAAGHKRHLMEQFLMRAAENGIPLQQRQEQKVLVVLNTVVRVGIHFATGATV